MAPSRVLFPTPLPPKMPMRWPLPHGRSPSMARTPVTSGWVMCSRSSGLTGAPYRLYCACSSMAGPSSIGSPKPSMTRPNSPGDTGTRASWLRAATRSPNWSPSISSSGMESTRPLRKPITWARIRRPAAVSSSQKSPTATLGPCDSTSSPTSWVTLPVQRIGDTRSSSAKYGASEMDSVKRASAGNPPVRVRFREAAHPPMRPDCRARFRRSRRPAPARHRRRLPPAGPPRSCGAVRSAERRATDAP